MIEVRILLRNTGPNRHGKPVNKVWGYGVLHGRFVYFWGRENRITKYKYLGNKNEQFLIAGRKRKGYVEDTSITLDQSQMVESRA